MTFIHASNITFFFSLSEYSDENMMDSIQFGNLFWSNTSTHSTG